MAVFAVAAGAMFGAAGEPLAVVELVEEAEVVLPDEPLDAELPFADADPGTRPS